MCIGLGFFHLWGFIPRVGPISSQSWVIMGGCIVKITHENWKRKTLRTSRLLIKVSVADPGISLLHQGHRICYPNYFGSFSQQSSWAHVEFVIFWCLSCAGGVGANLPKGHGYSILERCGASHGSSPVEAEGSPVLLAWLHPQVALENLSLQHGCVSSPLTHEHAHCFNPAPGASYCFIKYLQHWFPVSALWEQ